MYQRLFAKVARFWTERSAFQHRQDRSKVNETARRACGWCSAPGAVSTRTVATSAAVRQEQSCRDVLLCRTAPVRI
jgi:hypothetical protein